MTWQDRAACKDMVTDDFFPVGEKGDPPEATKKGRHALRICFTCSVREECLRYAMTPYWSISGGPEPQAVKVAFQGDGIWGGTVPTWRARYRHKSVEDLLNYSKERVESLRIPIRGWRAA